MQSFLINIVILVVILYVLFLYKSRIHIATMYWIGFFLISFILPVLLNENMLSGYAVIYSQTYEKLNSMYLLMLIVFVFSNAITKKIKIKNRTNKFTRLNYVTLKKTSNIFVLLSLIFVLMAGGESILIGSSNIFNGTEPIIGFLVPIVVFGVNMSSHLRLFYAQNKKQIIYSLLIVFYAIAFGLLFSFARRLVIYPLIISFCFKLIVTKRKIKFIKTFVIVMSLVLIVLPLMISIRTFGLVDGILNLKNIISDYDILRKYLAMSTDVSWSYSLAAIILQGDIHFSPIALLKPIITFIPRTIWNSKPLPLSLEIVRELNLSDNSNMSIPVGIVGESFVYFGLIGIFIYGLFWGITTAYLDKKIVHVTDKSGNSNAFTLMFFITLAIQIISGSLRGDFATTLLETEFVILPFFVILKIMNIKYKL